MCAGWGGHTALLLWGTLGGYLPLPSSNAAVRPSTFLPRGGQPLLS